MVRCCYAHTCLGLLLFIRSIHHHLVIHTHAHLFIHNQSNLPPNPKQVNSMEGILKVDLVDAKALRNTDSLGKMDPYVLLHYKDQHLKSRVAKDHGRNPVWNDNFTIFVHFPEPDGDYSIFLKIMDKDTFSADDLIGETRIDLKELIVSGAAKGSEELAPRYYNVLDKNKALGGEIQVAFSVMIKEEIKVC